MCNGTTVIDPFESIAGHVSTLRASVVDPNHNNQGIYNEYGKFIPADQNQSGGSPSSQQPMVGSPDPYGSLSPLATPYQNTNINSAELPPGVTYDSAMASIRNCPMYKATLRQNGKFVQKSGFTTIEEAENAYRQMKDGASTSEQPFSGVAPTASTARNVGNQLVMDGSVPIPLNHNSVANRLGNIISNAR